VGLVPYSRLVIYSYSYYAPASRLLAAALFFFAPYPIVRVFD
jgi:hypothetical protein